MRPALAAAKAPENLWELSAQDFIAKANCAAGKNGSAHSILFGTRPDISWAMPFYSHVAAYNTSPNGRFATRSTPARYVGPDFRGGISAIHVRVGRATRRVRSYRYIGPPHGTLDETSMTVTVPPDPAVGPPAPPAADTYDSDDDADDWPKTDDTFIGPDIRDIGR